MPQKRYRPEEIIAKLGATQGGQFLTVIDNIERTPFESIGKGAYILSTPRTQEYNAWRGWC